MQTSRGELRFSSISSPATFSATAAPAPGAAALIGLVGAVGARRRRA
jgi:MYXO-CTERM domain-containing protein